MGNDDERRDHAVVEERIAPSSLEGSRRTVVPPAEGIPDLGVGGYAVGWPRSFVTQPPP
jgi:hypothetical protein